MKIDLNDIEHFEKKSEKEEIFLLKEKIKNLEKINRLLIKNLKKINYLIKEKLQENGL